MDPNVPAAKTSFHFSAHPFTTFPPSYLGQLGGICTGLQSSSAYAEHLARALLLLAIEFVGIGSLSFGGYALVLTSNVECMGNPCGTSTAAMEALSRPMRRGPDGPP